MISFITTAIGGIMTISATSDGARAVGAAMLAAGLSSSLRQLESRG